MQEGPQGNFQADKTDALKAGITIDDFDFDNEIDDLNNLSFKPINEGLGFHHEKKEAPKKTAPRPQLKPLAAKNQPMPGEESGPSRQADLKAFYNDPRHKEEILPTRPIQTPVALREEKAKKEIEKEVVWEKAPAFLTIGAWIIDVMMIVMSLGLTLSLLTLASGLEIKELATMFADLEIFIYVATLFFIYYMLYFSILDMSATFGKSLMGIKLVTTNNKPVRVKHTFVRAFVTLTSFIAIGLPLLMNFQGKLSDTFVVKK